MNKCRLRWLLALPLLLCVLLGAAKWKQLHPTPTALDLQERAFLRDAKSVRATIGCKQIELPVAEFKAALDDFYLTDAGDDYGAMLKSSGKSPQKGPNINIDVFCKLNKGFKPSAGILLSEVTFYGANGNERNGATQKQKPVFAKIHPITERRLRELVAKHMTDR